MLNRWFAPRFAHSDVPEKEQRLCGFVREEKNHSDESNESSAEHSAHARNPIGDITETMRQRLAKLDMVRDVHLLEHNAPLSDQKEFMEHHAETLLAMGSIDARGSDIPDEEVLTVVSEVRDRLLEETMKRPEKEIPHVWFNSGEDFEAAYLKSRIGVIEWGNKSLSKLRNEARQRGMDLDDQPQSFRQPQDTEVALTYWRERLMHNDWQDATVEQLRRAAEKRGIDINKIPTAFQVGTNIYFNGTHEDFTDPKRRERAIAHELTHFVIDTRPRSLIQTINSYLQNNPARYDEMKTAARTLMKEQQEEGSLQHDELHEILAIFIADKRHAFSAGSNHEKICALMKEAIQDEPQLKKMIYALDELGVQWRYADDAQTLEESVQEQFVESLQEKEVKEELANVLAGEKEVPGTDLRLHTNIDEEARKEAQANLQRERALEEAAQKEASQAYKLEPSYVMQEVDYGLGLVQHFREWLPSLKKDFNGQNVETATIDYALERLSESGNRLNSLKKSIERVHGSREQRLEQMKAIRNELLVIMAPLKALLQKEEQAKSEKIEKTEKNALSQARKIMNENIRWLSVYDMLKLFNVYKDAISNSYKSQQEVRVFGAARDLAKVFGKLPYGKPVEQILLKQARAANDEETSKFADYIKSEGFTHDELLEGPNSALEQNRHNVNRSKAIIEYAADHGWLYKMNKKNGHDVYGVDFERWFGKHSFLELINRNESGKEKEVKRGEERVRYHPDIPLIIEDIEHELKEKNIYAVRGMLQVLQNKAKYAESNTWGLMTLFSALRDNPQLREIMEKGLLDNIGNIGIAQSAWSLTMFKLQRHEFMKWKTMGDSALASPDFVLASTIQRIEDMIPEKEKKLLTTTDKNHLIGHVLAGQTHVCSDGTILSIFLDRFSDYRRYWLTHATSTEPGKTDDDFFNPDNGGSDVLLLPGSSIADILTRQSQGPYVHRTKAHNFLTMVLMREKDLRSSAEAHKNFIEEMKQKLEFAWKEVYTQDAACNQLTYDKSLDYVGPAQNFSDIFLLDELYENKLLSQELYYRIIVNSKGLKTKTQSEILQRLGQRADEYKKPK